MADNKEFQRRVWRRLIGTPFTVVTSVVATLGLSGAVLAHEPWTGLAITALAVCAGAGKIGYDLATGRVRQVSKETRERIQQQRVEEEERATAAFRAKLAADDDPRDEVIFDELEALMPRFRAPQPWMQKTNEAFVLEAVMAAEDMHGIILYKLNESYDLLQESRGLPPAAERSILETRERVLTEAREAIDGLSEMYVTAQRKAVEKTVKGASDGSGDVKRIRDRFQQAIEIDNRVEGADAELEERRQRYRRKAREG